jgi:aminoglycoside phosphotransferase (APT) family kinase protein
VALHESNDLHDVVSCSPSHKNKTKQNKVRQFKHGQSNPTFLLADGSGTKYVLRKKPPGKLLSSAHMVLPTNTAPALSASDLLIYAFVPCVGNVKVEREYMVMKALKQVRAHHLPARSAMHGQRVPLTVRIAGELSGARPAGLHGRLERHRHALLHHAVRHVRLHLLYP